MYSSPKKQAKFLDGPIIKKARFGRTTRVLDNDSNESFDGTTSKWSDLANTLLTPNDVPILGRKEIPFHLPHERILRKLKDNFVPATVTERKSFYRRRSIARLAREKNITYRGSPPLDFHDIFVKMRTKGDYRFLYLLPNSEDQNDGLYSFKEVPYNQVDLKFYLTISNYGVIVHSENSATFISLDEWERDYHFYQKVKRITFFQKFQLWKFFFVWRRTIVWNKFEQARNKIELNLFHLDIDLSCLLRKIYLLSLKRQRAFFPDITRIENFHLNDYLLIQENKYSVIAENLFDFVEYLTQLIRDFLNLMFDKVEQSYKVQQTERLGTQRKLKEDAIARMSSLEKSKRKILHEKLTRFIFLIDIIFNEITCSVLRNSYSHLKQGFENHTEFIPDDNVLLADTMDGIEIPRPVMKPQNGFFHITVSANSESIILIPDEVKFVESFQKMMFSWETLCLDLPCLVTHPALKHIVCPIIGGRALGQLMTNGPSRKFAIDTNKEIRNILDENIMIIKSNYSAVYKFLNRFNSIIDLHRKNCQTNVDDITNETDPTNLRQLLTTYHYQIELVQKVNNQQILGLFILHMDSLKNEVRPVCINLLKITEQTIPKLAISKIANLFMRCDEGMNVLENPPQTTEEFVSYLKFIDYINEEVVNITEEFSYVRDIFEIIKEHKVPCTKDDLEFFDKLSVLLDRLTTLCTKKEQEKKNIVEKLAERINLEVAEETQKILAIHSHILEDWLISKDSNVNECVKTLKQLEGQLAVHLKNATQIKQYQKQFYLEIARFSELETALTDLKIRQLLWDSLNSWSSSLKEYENGNFNELNAEEISKFVAKMLKNIVQIDKAIPQNDITGDFKNAVNILREKIPVISYLRNPALKNRHWIQIESVLNYKFVPGETFTLKQYENLGVFEFAAELEEISTQASSEAALETLLKKIENSWKDLEFIVINYRDTKDIFILGSIEDIQQVLDDSFININTILSSRHVGPIKGRAETWLKNLDLFSKTLDEWIACQSNWLYLESIFSAPDIQRQLPTEARLFLNVDKTWKNIMRRTKENPLAIQAAIIPGTLEALENNNVLIEQIMKCLEAYLESKRVVFPRFYFLSNDELLEILAQTRNPQAVQPHLMKCFDAIKMLSFGQDIKEGQPSVDIFAMISPEKEVVQFAKTIQARGNVEDWLGKVEDIMFKSLKRAMRFALVDFDKKDRELWVLDHPSQIILTVSQIVWCRAVHKVFESMKSSPNAMRDFEKQNFLNLNKLADMVRGELTSLQRSVICSLITLDVHARDIITQLVVERVDNSDSFNWLKFLRYYWNPELEDCIVCMSTAQCVYGHEYLGASPRLVVTPLTDKCYLCLMGALQLDLGGAPSGPAGTGKTETTKDLAKAVAVLCVVFNCSESLDFKMMGRFFSGLASCGAWCCFDEFNRIDIEVLSVIAQQLLTIRNAKVAKLARFVFEGREIKLVPRCAVFITMNPGYAGRTELPDNLKALFRPMAMMIPDYALIAEVILYSEGFLSSKILAHKMTQMYKLCSEQLSQQNHYDFGMRALKSVLVMAGQLKRAHPNINENIVLIRALRDSNIPKFLADDTSLFQGILSDMFPGVVIPQQDYGILQKAIKQELIKMHLQPESFITKKVIQFYETLVVRHGVMLVGPTGGGKSTVLRALKSSLTQLHLEEVEHADYRPVTTYFLNPKSITIGELYGEVVTATQEWKDGILAIAVRSAVQHEGDHHHWIVCDGPVDAVWIENMNTVLDDNKMLCLANSERIKLTPRVRLVFEVQDLAQASPATVSRCGMIYVDPSELRWRPFLKTWMATNLANTSFPNSHNQYLIGLFDNYVNSSLAYIQRNGQFFIHQVEISKVVTICKLLESFFILPELFNNMDNLNVSLENIISALFIFSMLWGIGGNLIEKSRPPFEQFIRNGIKNNKDIVIPETESLWDLYVDLESGEFKNWSNLVKPFDFNPEVPYFDILVPTADTVCFGFLLKKFISVKHGVLFTGYTGVGKSVIAKSELSRLTTGGDYSTTFLNFSAQTNSARVQEMIEVNLEKKKKTLLGPPGGRTMIVFIDDVNMPALDTYGSQPPIELLRQYLDYGGFYDREKLFWRGIHNVIICAGCAPPGGGRNPITPRFVRHFALLGIPSASDNVLDTIFQAILGGFLKDFVPAVKALTNTIVQTARAVYKRALSDLLPTPAKSHYVFNLRDLSKCIQGVLQANSGTMREPNQILRLFYHECVRVFSDRLNCVEDKAFFYRTMKELCIKHFKTPVIDFDDKTLEHNFPLLIFGDYMNPNANAGEKIYEEVKSLDKLRDILEDCLNDYNFLTNKNVKLIFFRDALEHCSRLARILRTEKGNGLLVGLGGMGKQSLSRLASHLNGFRCIQIELTQSYDYAAFQTDLRKVFFTAGVEGLNTTFLITDSQIVREEFLEDVSNILNSGEVPNLFEADEYEKIIQGMRIYCKNPSVEGVSRERIFELFSSRARDRLHLMLCMSPVGDSFRRRCRMFPSLVNCCTINWFLPWPAEALLSVAQGSMKNVIEADMCRKLAHICVAMHESVEIMTHRLLVEKRRYFYTTPSTYLQLLKQFKEMLATKTDEIRLARDRFSNGLKKLYDTNAVVDTMKEELLVLEPLLTKKSETTNELLKILTKEQAEADKVRQIVLADEAVAKVKAAETQALADDAQKDLAEAMPAMEAAMKALDALNKADIGEVKTFTKPPELVKVVMEAVCLLLGVKQDWTSAKILLSDVNFLKKLQEFDKEHMSENMLKVLRTKYINNPDFVPDKVATQSKVCKSLCMWVRALDFFAKVFKVVEPKRRAVELAEGELHQIMDVLREKQKKLAEVEAEIADLETKFDVSMAEMKQVQEMMALTAARLNRSGRLTSALGDEQVRWETQVQFFTDRLHNMTGDILLSAACVAYSGPFTSDFREELIATWLGECEKYKISASSNFNIVSILADPYEIRCWTAFGLPRDSVSAENGVLVTRSSKWPLLIDPQGQANRWIRGLEADNGLKILREDEAHLITHLGAAVRSGIPVLLEDVQETLNPSLEPLLLKQTFVQGGLTVIRLGDATVEYSSNFRLYITTKLANPHYMPETCILVTLINFTVTVTGLEDQLLADVVRLERPDLEKTRTELITRINADKAQLKAIEEKILKLLYAATGNILDDEGLIDTLNESKETTEVVAMRLEEAESTEAKISSARNKYRAVATRGSILYWVVSQLSLVDPMYQYSLKYFSQVFNSVVETTKKSTDLVARVKLLMNEITFAVFTNISRGLFERHKLVFSFLICGTIMRHVGEISENYWSFLLRGPHPGKMEGEENNSNLEHVSERAWLALNYLKKECPVFKNIMNDLSSKITIRLGDFEDNVTGQTLKNASTDWNHTLSNFEKLMLFKALKEEQLVFAVSEFVKINLGQKFIESPSVSLPQLYADTSSVTPLVFILSPGSDPFGAFQKFAASKGYSSRVLSISLGQGQGPIAEKMLNDGAQQGDWVFLQNCHLATSWMPLMERKFLNIADSGDKIHQEFRIFLSSMPFKAFPVAVLQNSVKVTNEPPRGLRANIQRSLMDMNTTFFEDNPLLANWRKMVFGLCFFHAYVQERKKFGPLGWNIAYEFNDSDRDCALSILKMFCVNMNIPWNALTYTTGEITYGGRVTDPWDLRLLKTALQNFFSINCLESGYLYSKSGTYYCPESITCKTLPEYKKFVDQFPLIEDAEIFGMSENANIVYKIRETNALLSTILEMQPRESSASGAKSDDDIVMDLADSIQSKILNKIGMERINEELTKKDHHGRSKPLTVVLLQEVDKYNYLLKIITNSLQELKKAIKGEVVMSESLENVYMAFISNQIPQLWSKIAYPSLKPLANWIHDLELRIDFIQAWLMFGKPSSFWLSGLYFPQGFLTAVLQTFARKHHTPIDQLRFAFNFQRSYLDQNEIWKDHKDLGQEATYGDLIPPKEGIFGHGLLLEAARWDDRKMQLENAFPGQMLAVMPVVHLEPTPTMPKTSGHYLCPLYKTAERAGVLSTTGSSTNFILPVPLPTDRNPLQWILMGTALLTQTRD